MRLWRSPPTWSAILQDLQLRHAYRYRALPFLRCIERHMKSSKSCCPALDEIRLNRWQGLDRKAASVCASLRKLVEPLNLACDDAESPGSFVNTTFSSPML